MSNEPFLPKSYYKKQKRNAKPKASALWGHIFFIAIGLVFVVTGIFTTWQQITIRTTWRLLEAEVIELGEITLNLSKDENGKNTDFYDHKYKYKFVFDGKEYETWSKPYKGYTYRFAIGDKVKTHVNPKNPYECSDEYHFTFVTFLPIIIGFVPIIIGTVFIILEYKRVKKTMVEN